MKTLDQPTAISHARQARKLIADFQALLQNIGPAQIVAGARQHLQAIGRLGKTP